MVFVRCRGGCRSCQWHRSLRPDPRLARLADDAVLCCAEDTLQGVLQFLSGTDQARAACASRALNQCYEGCRANRGFSCDSLPLTDCGSDESGADTGHSTADDEYEEPRVHRRMRFQQRREERGQRERWEWDNGLYHAGAAAVLPGHELPARTEKEQQVRWMLRIFEAVTISGGYLEYDRPRWDCDNGVSALLAFFRRACLTQIGKQRKTAKRTSSKMPTSNLQMCWSVVVQVCATMSYESYLFERGDEIGILFNELDRYAHGSQHDETLETRQDNNEKQQAQAMLCVCWTRYGDASCSAGRVL